MGPDPRLEELIWVTPDQIVRSLEQGADDHWSKVHGIDELAVRVGTALRRRRSFARNWRRDASHLAQRR